MIIKTLFPSLVLLFLFSFTNIKAENPGETLIDIDGNVYQTAKFGDQVWMLDNLKVKRYRNGDSIQTSDPFSMNVCEMDSAKYLWEYGVAFHLYECTYYTWQTIMDSRQIAPLGWHVPTIEEWEKLFIEIKNGSEFENEKDKPIVFEHYAYGYRGCEGKIKYENDRETIWWTTDINGNKEAYTIIINVYNYYIKNRPYRLNNGFPVICVKD